MINHFPSPILSVAADVVSELQGEEALYGLWNLFTKCKESLKDGRRLENISWRLWYREMAASGYSPASSPGSSSPPLSEKYDRSPSPITPLSEYGSTDSNLYLPQDSNALLSHSNHLVPQAHSWHGETPTPSALGPSRRLSSASMPMHQSGTRKVVQPSLAVGRFIIDILPSKLDTLLPLGSGIISKKEPSHQHATVTPAVPQIQLAQPRPLAPSLPIMRLPSPSPHAPGSFPRVVVVNPTPHPTPPATPVLHNQAAHAPDSTQAPSFLLPPPHTARASASASASASGRATQVSSSSSISGALVADRTTVTVSKQLPAQAAADTHVRSHVSSTNAPVAVPTLAAPARPNGIKGSISSNNSTTQSEANAPPPDQDRRFFFPKASPDQASPKNTSADADAAVTVLSASASSAASSQMKSPLSETGSKRGAANGQGRGRRREITRNTHMHAAIRPALHRMHTAPQRQIAQKKVAGEPAPTKKLAFNVGSNSSNGSRESGSKNSNGPVSPPAAVTKGPAAVSSAAPPTSKSNASLKSKQTSQTQVARNPPPQLPVPSPIKPIVNVTNDTAASMQKRGIVVSSSSDYETTSDSDEDSEWASEDASVGDREREEQETQLRQAVKDAQAAEEAQRQRDMFVKMPRRSYSNLNRGRSGLLSQLLNPDPSIFPPDHPFSMSTQDMTRLGRVGQGIGPRGSGLTMTRSSAAVPLTAQVTAEVPPTVIGGLTATKPSGVNANNGYQKRGRPQNAELEDDSESENPDDAIQLSHSLAQQKLAALAGSSRRRSDNGTGKNDNAHNARMTDRAASTSKVGPAPGSNQTVMRPLTTVATAPIPLCHPYNLPAPAPPSTPRTTRRQMLATELSESLRRNLLWERQVSRINMTGGARRSGVLGGLRPMTAAHPEGAPSGSKNDGRTAGGGPGGGAGAGANGQAAVDKEHEETRQEALARRRSWAEEYHYTGW